MIKICQLRRYLIYWSWVWTYRILTNYRKFRIQLKNILFTWEKSCLISIIWWMDNAYSSVYLGVTAGQMLQAVGYQVSVWLTSWVSGSTWWSWQEALAGVGFTEVSAGSKLPNQCPGRFPVGTETLFYGLINVLEGSFFDLLWNVFITRIKTTEIVLKTVAYWLLS